MGCLLISLKNHVFHKVNQTSLHEWNFRAPSIFCPVFTPPSWAPHTCEISQACTLKQRFNQNQIGIHCTAIKIKPPWCKHKSAGRQGSCQPDWFDKFDKWQCMQEREVKLPSFHVSSRVNAICVAHQQHWDEHPHSTLCMWKVPVWWHGCCLCARPG